LAPEEWHAQIYRLNEDQLIGLRFASDEEVVELAKQALSRTSTATDQRTHQGMAARRLAV